MSCQELVINHDFFFLYLFDENTLKDTHIGWFINIKQSSYISKFADFIDGA